MEQLHRRYQGRASVVFVYIAEAHAVDEWQLPANLDDDVLLRQHTTLDDRRAAARAGVERLGLTMPVLVDGMDDAVSEAFAAWPERLTVAAEPGGSCPSAAPGRSSSTRTGPRTPSPALVALRPPLQADVVGA